MPATELWVVSMNAREENYNVYFSKERAQAAVKIMRDRLGEDADHFDPRIVGRVAEGEAFGEEVSVKGKRQYEEVFL